MSRSIGNKSLEQHKKELEEIKLRLKESKADTQRTLRRTLINRAKWNAEFTRIENLLKVHFKR